MEYAIKSIDKAFDADKLSGLVALIIFCYVFIKLFIVTLNDESLFIAFAGSLSVSKLAGAEFIKSLIFCISLFFV